MKNFSFIVTVGIVLAVLVGAGYVFLQKNGMSSTEISKKPEVSRTQVEQTMMKEGKYLPYSPEVFASTPTTRRVLFFYANWCPTCKPADESFSQNTSQLPSDVTVIRVNYNDTDTDQAEKDLAKKYGVTYQHTFVQIDEQGNEVVKWNGGSIDELLKNIK